MREYPHSCLLKMRASVFCCIWTQVRGRDHPVDPVMGPVVWLSLIIEVFSLLWYFHKCVKHLELTYQTSTIHRLLFTLIRVDHKCIWVSSAGNVCVCHASSTCFLTCIVLRCIYDTMTLHGLCTHGGEGTWCGVLLEHSRSSLNGNAFSACLSKLWVNNAWQWCQRRHLTAEIKPLCSPQGMGLFWSWSLADHRKPLFPFLLTA